MWQGQPWNANSWIQKPMLPSVILTLNKNSLTYSQHIHYKKESILKVKTGIKREDHVEMKRTTHKPTWQMTRD